MDTVVATFEAIARLATSADREALESLDAKCTTMVAAARAAIDLGTITDAGLVATGTAENAALETITRRRDALVMAQAALIEALPSDRRSRATLRTLARPRDVASLLDVIDSQVTHLNRNVGTPFHVLCDGVVMGGLDPYNLTMRGGLLTIGEHGSWPMARISAISIEEDDFGILLDDGTLLEIQEDVEFVWRDAVADAA